MIGKVLNSIIGRDSFVLAFGFVALLILAAYTIAKLIKQQKMGSAFAIILALVAAFVAGKITGGTKGMADFPVFAGFLILGGSALRDYTIVSTAYGVKMENLKKAGLAGTIALFVGVFFSFIVGTLIARILGFTDPKEITTIGAGAVTFIVGPVTGDALGVSSEVIALSVAAGVVKSVLTMIITPLIAKKIKLDNPTTAMVYGGMIGTTSGVAGGLAATDIKLVPYGAMTATFYTGLGTLLCPSIGYLIVNLIF
ncbi:MAG: malonate transporter subunit MadM [Spirochaetales bacterium]|nr:malonate transporter subunit MadM [Spirochaetales bacterium]